jgi:hypothetical protein
MSLVKFCQRPNVQRNVLFILTGFTILKMITGLISLVYFSMQLVDMDQYRYIYDYKSGYRTIETVRVVELTGCNRWLTVYTSNNGEDIIENPFSAKTTITAADKEKDERPLSSLQSCTCRPNSLPNTIKPVGSNCYVWATCFFNTDFLDYLQIDGRARRSENVSFMVGGLSIILLSCITIPISCMLYCNSKPEYVELD